ncbi:hypothetical protein XENORESO_010123, partial [Xenotaenia resolanae]
TVPVSYSRDDQLCVAHPHLPGLHHRTKAIISFLGDSSLCYHGNTAAVQLLEIPRAFTLCPHRGKL